MKIALTKREMNRLHRRTAIVEIATRSFLERGYAATSMTAISDELGGSKATLWSHFTSKEELFAAVVDGLVDRFAASMGDPLDSHAFSVEGLRDHCVRLARKLLTPDAISLFSLIIAEGRRFPEIRHVFHDRAPARAQRQMTAFLATAMDAAEAARMARIVNAAMVGYRTHALTRPELPTDEEIVQFVDDFIAHLRLPAYESIPEDNSG